jgi:hypothetical protein
VAACSGFIGGAGRSRLRASLHREQAGSLLKLVQTIVRDTARPHAPGSCFVGM